MPRKKSDEADQLNLLEAKTRTAPCVPAIRKAVAGWKAGGYKGVTETTRLLLNFWFKSDHRLPNRRRFAYHRSQQEAIETLIYLFEVVKVRRQKTMLELYAPGGTTPQLLQHDEFARYCIKMATGSGKTKVMALAIAWQYFNAVRENSADYARTFLVLAPNVIVFERLSTDFAGGRIFRADPIIPPEFQLEWDFDSYLRGEPERASSQGALYLTNIQDSCLFSCLARLHSATWKQIVGVSVAYPLYQQQLRILNQDDGTAFHGAIYLSFRWRTVQTAKNSIDQAVVEMLSGACG